MKFKTLVRNGKINPIQSERLVSFIRDNEGKELVFHVVIKSKERSLPQNAYFHAVILTMIANKLKHLGNDYTSREGLETLKAVLCDRFLTHKEYDVPLKMMLSPRDNTLMVSRGTSDLNTKEFEEFCEKCRRWASEFLKIDIPEPNEEETNRYWLNAEE